uniref:Anoctamin n=1 Tax=Romanomermis culicivorax TaxID=13658 RepID=A0A915L4L4_ROMCU
MKVESNAYRIHAPFTLEDQQKFDISDRDAFFEDRHRIEIVWEILQKVPCDPNDVRKRGIEFLLAQKIYDAAYPLHDGDAPFVRRKGDEADAAGDHLTRRQFLKDKWADWKAFCRDQPLNQVWIIFDCDLACRQQISWSRSGSKINNIWDKDFIHTVDLEDSQSKGNKNVHLTDRILDEKFSIKVGHIFYAKMTSETHKASKRLMKYLRKTDEPGLFFVKIRDYFGEKVAFYFLFMDFYTKMLAWPAIFGLLTFFYGLIYTDYYSEDMRHVCDANSTPGKYLMCPICQPPDCDPWSMAEDGCLKYKWEYRIDNFGSFMHTCLTTLWSIIFFKTWKRRESRVSVLWDTYDAEEHDHSIRPAYEQRAVYERQNPITGETEKYIPSHYKTFWMTFSVMVTLAMLVIDSVSLMVLVMSRIALYGLLKRSSFHSHIATYNVEYARWIVHGLILIMILIFERVFSFVAHILTDYECPKTQKRYTTSLLWKLFIFELLNDFIPLGYAAWMKQTWVRTPRDLNFLSELCDGGCLSEVAELITLNIVLKPRGSIEEMSTTLDGVYGEYMEMMVQFSFVVMFVPASPVAALVCFLNNIVEIRIDSMKLLVTKRRPVPIRVPGVQIWNRFMDILVKVGIVCNAALLAFTSEIVPRFYYDYLYPMRNNFTGYTHFSLSEISTEGWLNLSASVSSEFEAKGYNGSECYYQDNRHREPPYSLRTEFWEISTARVSMFAIYSCLFFILMWLVNLLVDDVPADVKDRIKRNKYLMATGSRSLAPNLHKNYQDLMRKVPNIINDLNNDDYAVAGGNSSPDDNTSAGLANGAAVDDEPPAGDVDFGATAPTMTAAPFPTITVENLRRATAKQQENGSALTNGSYKRRNHLLPPIESTITTPV